MNPPYASSCSSSIQRRDIELRLASHWRLARARGGARELRLGLDRPRWIRSRRCRTSFTYLNASGSIPALHVASGNDDALPGSVAGDIQPQSAGGKVVFTSYGISGLNPEIYIANLDGSERNTAHQHDS